MTKGSLPSGVLGNPDYSCEFLLSNGIDVRVQLRTREAMALVYLTGHHIGPADDEFVDALTESLESWLATFPLACDPYDPRR